MAESSHPSLTLPSLCAVVVTYGAGDPPAELGAAFQQVERLRVVPIRYRGQHLRDFSIFLGRNFQGFPPRAFTGY